jgi:putative membrane-bound dehydrogenase-like protein
MSIHPMTARLIPALLSIAMPVLAADGIKSKTTYAAAYGPTNNSVLVDPAKELPRYPAVEPKNAVSTWQVKKGFKLELVANEPLVRDPIAVCFDERGRMFVCEMIDYSEMRDVTPHLGRISVLEDKDGDGFFETSRVFADDLAWPTGLIWANGGLYVGATPDIWRFEDKDDDGKAEVREKVYTGFGTGLKLLNVQGLMNSFQWGQDNRVHVLAGGGNRGLIKCLKRPELPEQELGGRDFWFDPLTHEFGLELGGAQYGMSFDNYGRKFGCSNSDHLQYWVYDDRNAARNPYFDMPSSRKSIAADGGAAEVFRISPDEPWRIIRTRWRISGVVKGAVEGGGRVSGYFTGATGTTIYRGDAYGPEFVNNSFTGDAGGQLVHRKIIRYAENGIDLIGERPADEHGFEFAASKDTWVRVVNFANAPDGCLHVCDMYREVIEHPWSVPDEIKKHLDLNNGNDRGRIYRIVPEGWQRQKGEERRGNIAKASTAELVKTLGHTNGWQRDAASRLLYERQDKSAVAPLRALLNEKGAPLAKIHALNALAGLKALDDATLSKALGDADAFVRERAIVLTPQPDAPEIQKALQALSDDPAPRVRMAYAMLLSKSSGAVAQQLKLAQTSASNPWITAAILNGSDKNAVKLLEDVVSSSNRELKGGFSQSLLGVIGQQRDPAATAYAIRVLSADDTPASLRKDGLKAFATGLRRAGTSITKVDTEGKLAAVFTKAAATALDAKAPESARIEALELLSLATRDQAQAAMQACLKADQSEKVQTAAVKSLSELGGKTAATLLPAWKGLKPKARDAVLGTLLARDDGALELLEAISSQNGPSPKDLAASQIQALVKHKTAKVAELARTALASMIPPSREEVVKKFKDALTMKGDAKAGTQVFLTRCIACHVANAQGIEVGPNLVTVKTKGRDGILTAILEPHKEVASQYIAYTVNTRDGQTLTGIIAKDDANSMTLKMMGGAQATVQRSNIQGSSSSGQSLMPEGLETGMSVQDMADLLSFIESVK